MARLNVPPGPKGRFLVGNTLQYVADPLGFLTRASREHGDIVRLRMGLMDYVLVGNPDLISQVLREQHSNFHKDKLTRFISPVIGNGLLTSEGEFWRRQRKLAQPAFQHHQVQRYGEVMVEYTERMLAKWHDGMSFDVHQAMMGLTLQIVAKTLFGANVEEQTQEVGEALEILMDYYLRPTQWFRIREWIPTSATRRFWHANRRLNAIIYNIIRNRRAGGNDQDDLLSRLLSALDDEGSGMTDRQVRDEVVTLFLAGHETTALVLSYTFDLLARSPDAEARLVAEIDEVAGDRDLKAADLPRLRFADWVVKESMRLYPPAWAIGREALSHFELGHYQIPKGTQVLLCQWSVHRDPRWFDEPDRFQPERWDNDLIKTLPRGAYFPFGDGPRVCIGNHFAIMEAVLILCAILRRFRLTLASPAPLDFIPSITLRPKGGVRVVAHRREVCSTTSTPRPKSKGESGIGETDSASI